MRLDAALKRHAMTKAGEEALLFQGCRLSWGELDQSVNRVANALLKLGARHGDRIMLLMNNSVEFIAVYYALARIGCISAPVMPTLTAADIEYIADTLSARIIIADGASCELADAIAGKVSSVTAVIGVGGDHALPLDLAALTQDASPDDPGIDVDPHDPLTIKFTSGTTGTPKGCVRSHYNFTMASITILVETPVLEDDVGLIAQPFAAGMAVMLLALYVFKGVRMIVLPAFDAGQYLNAIESERVTHAAAMDWMARRFSAHPSFAATDLSSLRILHGINQLGSLIPIYAQGSFKAGITAGYASSEAGGLVTFKTPVDFARVVADPTFSGGHSSGRASRLHQVQCLDDQLRPLPSGEVGELAIKGPTIFTGYWKAPEETAKTLKDGWLLTGDLAEIDADGYMYLRGRKRDMIRTGGLNVYPAEIEPRLLLYPGISEIAVIGIPDREWGERVVACATASSAIDETAFMSFCRENLAPHKRPKAFYVLERFPMTASGKVKKADLVEIVQSLAQP
jgi:acyl-CoA synthetase (AMP-forming)/AMP-acid ligase II